MGLVSKDRISSLPDHLISHILSFLHTKEAASTSVLSKRWRLLFAFVTNLDFHDSMYLRSKESRDESPTIFREFVDRVLSLQGNIKVNKFSLSCVNAVDQARTTSWIYNVLGRGVSDIELNIINLWDVEYGYPLPSKLFVSKTLVKLTLLGGECLSASFGMEDVFLPKLKTLSLQDLSFEESDVGFAKLISGCPVLEELALFNMWNVCSVSITTLKRLTFFCENKVWNPESVSFDTPNLVYLVYVDAIANEYPKVSFDSLVEAYVGLRLTKWWGTPQSFFLEGDEEEQMVGNATKFLMGVCNVQILSLSPEALEVLAFCCEATPVFNNLIQLTIDSDSETGWESLPGLLKNCPNLETLVFKDLDHKRVLL